MTSAAVTSITVRQILPNSGASMYVVTGTKGNVADYFTWNAVINASTSNMAITPIQNMYFATATNGATGGAADAAFFSNSTKKVTLTAGTAAGRMILVGTC